jgi:hypothetical protein
LSSDKLQDTTRSPLLVHRAVLIRCLATRAMPKLLRRDWRMTKVPRPARASNNAKDASADGKEKLCQSLLLIDSQAKVSALIRLKSLGA